MEILDKNDLNAVGEYERFNIEHGNFMQSPQWAGVKGNWAWEVVISRNAQGGIRGTCMVLIRKIRAAGSAFMYAPRGPVSDPDDSEALEDIFKGIRAVASKYKAYRFMCDPPFEEEKITPALAALKFKHKENAPPSDTVQPRANYILKNISGKSEEELITLFRTDHRNRVRKAPRKGVYCRICGAEAVDDFYPLMQQTGRRDDIMIRSKDYFKGFLNSFSEEQCRLFMCYAEIDGKEAPLSGAVAVRYGGTATYVYGASSDEHRNLYPNYLMQLEMIKWAVEGGCDIYDFGGIPYYDDETNSAYGLYRFKKGFNGEIVIFAGEYTFDFRPFVAKLADLASEIAFFRHRHKMRKSEKKSAKSNA